MANISMTSTTTDLLPILGQLKTYFIENYQNNLETMILFGSQARGDASPDSDIDILVILKNQFNSYQENKKNSYFISELCLKNDIVITCFLMNLEAWKSTNNSFTRNIKKEGVILWIKILLSKRA